MRITSRRGTIVFFLCLGIGLVALAIALNVGWIILNWREGVLLVFGIIFFALIIAGMVVNTIFLVRELRHSEQHDSFINAVTHELKTPVASIRLHLETLQRRELPETQKQDFYRLMLSDTDRLTDTVEQVLRAGRAGDKKTGREKAEGDFAQLVRDCMDATRNRHHLQPEALRYEEASSNGSGLRVRGSAEDLRTAVFNVLDNAIKYSGETVDVRVLLDAPDEAHLAQGLRFNLEAEGYAAEVVGDGEGATDLLLTKKEGFDVVVLDIMLPGKDGFRVVSELRAARNYVPVLMLTARGRPEDVLKGFASGADDYLAKPFDLSILLARLQGLLRRSEWMKRQPADGAGEGESNSSGDFGTFSFAGRTIDFGELELRSDNS